MRRSGAEQQRGVSQSHGGPPDRSGLAGPVYSMPRSRSFGVVSRRGGVRRFLAVYLAR